jgi:GT2 family glycosyltransferase
LRSEIPGSPVVSICLVNYNDSGHLEACLRSIEADAREIPHEIIVADNASTDGSVALLAEKFPGVRSMRNVRNLGFGRANNLAARESQGQFLLFVNTDIVVHPGALPRLLDEMKENPLTGAAGPGLLNPGDAFQVSFGGRVNFFTEAIKKGLLNRMKSRALKKNRARREVGWISGAFLFVRKKAFLEAGAFDENLFLYFEDIDLCTRIREVGYKVVFLPESVSFHWGGAATAGAALRSRLEYRRSQLYFYRKHNSMISLFLLKLYLRISIAALTMKGALRNEPEDVRQGFRNLLKRPRT